MSKRSLYVWVVLPEQHFKLRIDHGRCRTVLPSVNAQPMFNVAAYFSGRALTPELLVEHYECAPVRIEVGT
jgi:hypothetical protein